MSSLLSARKAEDSVTSRQSRIPCNRVDLPVLFSPITTVVASVIGMSSVWIARKFFMTTRLILNAHSQSTVDETRNLRWSSQYGCPCDQLNTGRRELIVGGSVRISPVQQTARSRAAC